MNVRNLFVRGLLLVLFAASPGSILAASLPVDDSSANSTSAESPRPADDSSASQDDTGDETSGHETPYEESITVITSRTPVARNAIGASVTIIDREEIESRQSLYLADLLRDVAGLSISRSGSLGSVTQVRVRGAEANQVLVLIDGVAVSDVFAGDEIPLELLTSYDIQRIEVVRGPQSGLWGSDALAGVINIITVADPAPTPGATNGRAQVQGGSFSTLQGGGQWGRAGANTYFGLSGSYLDSDGTNTSRTGSEDDGVTQATAGAQFRWQAAERLALEVSARYTDSDTDFDTVDFVSTGLPTDADRHSETELALLNVRGDWGTGPRWNHRWTASLADSDTESFDSGASLGSTALQKGELSWQSTVRLGPVDGATDQRLTLALDHERREFEQRGAASPFGDPNQDQELDASGVAVEYRIATPKAWSLSASVRHDDHSDFDDVTTFRTTAAFTPGKGATRLRASVGSGQKPPTFVERFGFFSDQFFGNPNLEPETSFGWDFGVDRRLGQDAWLELTWFSSRLEDEINGFFFDTGSGLFTAVNETGTSDRQGVELALRADLGEQLDLSASYTFTDATEPNAQGVDEEELRRPRHTASARLRFRPTGSPLELMLNASHVGSQVDQFFPPFPQPQERVRLDDYLLVDVTARYRLGPRYELFARAENLLDEEYEDVLGFATPGIGAHLGFRIHGGAPGRGGS